MGLVVCYYWFNSRFETVPTFVCVVRFGSGLVVGQPYDLDASKEYVIRGNSAIIKCQYPSFMSDFLRVESWTIDDHTVATYSVDDYGTLPVAMETRPAPCHPLAPSKPLPRNFSGNESAAEY